MMIIKHIFLFFLGGLAKLVIIRHKPFVVGITGSVGKTTTRHFISSFLEKKGVDFYTPEGNYNGEFGLPLSILQSRSGGRNPVAWLGVFVKGFALLFATKYPDTLVLEYGIDRPGEMDFMCSIVEPDVAVFTFLSPNHIQQFRTAENYFGEKRKLVRQKKKNAKAIITNADDPNQADIQAAYRFGTDSSADLRITDLTHNESGLNLTTEGSSFQLSFFGLHNVATISPAILTLEALGFAREDIQETFCDIDLPHGRGNTLEGEKGSIVIDGSYNGGFASITAGLEMLASLGETLDRKTIAVIGDMRELGPIEQQMHEELAHFCRTLPIDEWIFVGPLNFQYVRPLFPKAAYTLSARTAGEYVYKRCDDAVIFAKGSQNTIFLEEAVKLFSADEEASKLVRQSDEWLQTKDEFFRTVEDQVHTQ